MVKPLSVNIIYNKTNTFGLKDDIKVINLVLQKLSSITSIPCGKPVTVDVREPLMFADINIHLEIPIYSAIPWAHTNMILVNPEHWSFAYYSYVNAFDAIILRDPVSADKFKECLSARNITHDNIFVVPWSASWGVENIKNIYGKNGELGFICFVAGSSSKYQYLSELLPYWRSEYPHLTVYTSRHDYAEDLMKLVNVSNISIQCKDLDYDTRCRLMTLYRGHLVCSSGESFGYAAANAEVAGAFTIMNNLPVFDYMYSGQSGVKWISNTYNSSDKTDFPVASITKNIQQELDSAIEAFSSANFNEIKKERQKTANGRFNKTCDGFRPILESINLRINELRPSKHTEIHCPPILKHSDCPPISIITPTYNREKLIDIAFHNLLLTDYPKNKIEWVVIEDNEQSDKMSTEKIVSFQIQVPDIKIKYIPIEGRMSIGEKRNYAIENSSHEIILFMDDDDHYPETSFRRRVAWLLNGRIKGQIGNEIVCCTTIALYDLQRGISAVNVPPYDIPFAQRISEATLTFKKSAWRERKFSDVSLSEGEEWISGREDKVLEIPPQQIIVAFSHGQNKSSRRIPPIEQKPSCFWGFPTEYLVFIHGLVGVKLVDKNNKEL